MEERKEMTGGDSVWAQITNFWLIIYIHPPTPTHTDPPIHTPTPTHTHTHTHTLTGHVDLVQEVVGIGDVGEGHSKSSLLPGPPFSLPASYKHTRQTHCKPINHKLEKRKEKSGGERERGEGKKEEIK